MPDQDPRLPWTEPGWLVQADGWIRAELVRQGIGMNSPIEQPHVRPWSTVLRVPTTKGALYFKATAPMLSHEPVLTMALARWRPDCIPRVLATDLERGWMLMSDEGETLRGLVRSIQDISHWRRILPLYAEVQIEMAGRLHQLLALGALDRRLALLPTLYEQLLDDAEAMRIDRPDGLTSEEYHRLRALTPWFIEMCAQLRGYDVPETLHHDDFHDANIFVRDGRYVFADWGESCAAHPFFTMVVTLRSIASRLSLKEGAPELVRLRDVYLGSWMGHESRENLSTVFALAQHAGRVNRALTWYHVVTSLEEPFREEHAGAVTGWLQVFLEGEAAVSG